MISRAAVSDRNGYSANTLAWMAALAGIVVFTLLLDPSITNPFNVGWLSNGDPAQAYFGWLFFRQEPWLFPPGAVHRMGMEQASSIVYSDSIPLLAMLLKLMRAWLPSTFQYFGLWLGACYALQGYFACRLLMLFTSHRAALAMGVLLFLLSPIMLFRAQPHLALTAHWIVIAALYLYYVTPNRRHLVLWLLLLWIAPLVNAYLMFMAYAIGGAYVLRYGVLVRRWPIHEVAAWVVFAVIGSLSTMWIAGFFLHMEVSSGGFGYFSMNLLAPFLPVGAGPFLLHTPASATTGQYEGFNYLGLGVSLALLLGVVRAIRNACKPKHPSTQTRLIRWRNSPDLALVLCCVALSALAITNQVTWGSHILFNLRMPPRIEVAMNVFRSSGRMFWPVYYVLVLAAIRGLLSLSRPVCARLLAVVLLIQVIDVYPFMRAVGHSSTSNAERARFPVFSSPFWARARSRYANIYVIPGRTENSADVATESLAASQGFALDTAYAARYPAAELQQPRLRRHAQFFEGILDPGGIYLIQSSTLEKLKSVENLLPSSAGVGVIDGVTVVAPHWFDHGAGGYLHRPEGHAFPEVAIGQNYQFGNPAADVATFMLAGWGNLMDTDAWSVGKSSLVALHVARVSGDLKITMDVAPYLPPAYPTLGVDVWMDGHLLTHWLFGHGTPGPDTSVVIPSSLRPADGNILLKLQFDHARSPMESHESSDVRKLGLQLRGLSVESR